MWNSLLKASIQMGDCSGFFRKCLRNTYDRNELECPIIRMSDLLNASATSEISDKSTDYQEKIDFDFGSQNNLEPQNMSVSTLETLINDMLNNSKPNNESQCEHQINQICNKTKENDDNKQKQHEEKINENDNDVEIKRSLSLVIPRHSFRIVNDLVKTQTPDVKRNSTQAMFSTVGISCTPIAKQQYQMFIGKENKPTSNHGDMTSEQKQIIRPIMGKNALLKRAYVDSTDSLIVQDIVLDKYTPVLNHYVTKMNQRRLSRTRLDSCDDDFSDRPCSSNTSYSPMSMSSPGSEHQGFVFPSIEEGVDKESKEIQNVNQRRIKKLQRSESFKTALSEDDLIKDQGNLDENTYSCSVASVGGTTCSDYDPEKFLKNAIGDVTSLSESGISSQMSQKFTSTKYGDSTMGSSDVSDLVSKLSSLYSSVKRGIRKRRSSLKPNQFLPIGEQLVNNCAENPHLESLKKELAMQNEITCQISKALMYCRSSKEFFYSAEHVEAERILLVALITKDVLISEINAIEFNNYQNIDDPRNKGEIEVSSIKFLPNENNIDFINELDHDSIKEYFLVVLSSGGKVISSKVLTTDEKGLIEVDKSFIFKNLSADFEISFTVYSMLVKDRERLLQEAANCPSPRNIFQFHKESKKTYKVTNEVPFIKTSAFRLLGRCCIRNAELSNTKQYNSLTLYDCPVHSRLSPCFTAKIISKNDMDVKVSGFLTVGIENDKACTIWNRRWCLLENSDLKYWNYPSEEMTPPLGVIDLSYCIEQKISSADRSSCARPRTLLVPIKNNTTIKKYLLSADSAKDLEMWEKELNFVIKSLTTWNCMC